MNNITIIIEHHGFRYEVTISSNILAVKKIMEDSGICVDQDFDELSKPVQEKILERLSKPQE